jgi:hypothetical protein
MQLFCEHHKRSQCIDAETHSRMLSPLAVWCVIAITDFYALVTQYFIVKQFPPRGASSSARGVPEASDNDKPL